MLETKSELRKYATATTSIIVAATLALSLSGCAPQRTKVQDAELAFIESKFVNDTYVEGFTPGKPDFGITIEMLLQREGLYDNSESFKTSVTAILEDANLSGSTESPTGYLYGEQGLKIDLAGKYAFASVAVNADNKGTREAIAEEAAGAFENSAVAPSDFAIAWLTLGLHATNNAHAAEVAEALVAAQNNDGGFDDYTPGDSTSDATGLALMALAAVQNSVDVKDSIARAKTYLLETLGNADHFDAYGSTNINGTAYAYMGLKAAGSKQAVLDTLQGWMKTQIQPDGGVQAGFAPGTSDTMATSQSILAINGRSYLELL